MKEVNLKPFTIAAIKSLIENSEEQLQLHEKVLAVSNNSFDLFLEEFKTCLDKFVSLIEKKRIELITASS